MKIVVQRMNGDCVEYDTTLVSYSSDEAVIMQDSLILSRLSEGIIMRRSYINARGEQPIFKVRGDAEIMIVAREDFPKVLYVEKDGDVILESDGNGGLVPPGHEE